ncbi:SCP2 sterol-binding domain-containing protein [Neptunicoccus sediminis]|uniref:SCP2 sterol-binding domain-containing protein n=1 Tax=Neptunicoccus sediminis TaxID=1892596 RepID=UPI000845CD40|nr:SCP2 sterol-binding domain-containing protein [Neptunicoccus sediminis]MBR9862027.1 SCP2 sterol-binding domain-containing protein [Paracoccaceae bacterium]
MSAVLQEFLDHLSPRVTGTLQGSAKLVIRDHGSVHLTDQGATLSDADADVTLTATEQTFRNILDGSQNPAMAFMSGKLKVDGSNMRALKVSEILTKA